MPQEVKQKDVQEAEAPSAAQGEYLKDTQAQPSRVVDPTDVVKDIIGNLVLQLAQAQAENQVLRRQLAAARTQQSG